MEMPIPDAAVILRRDEIAGALRTIVPGDIWNALLKTAVGVQV